MGLDMYLYRQRADEPPITEQLDKINAEDFDDGWIERYEASSGAHQVAYWRKANAVHRWFVEHFQDGVDECQESKPISREALAGLVERCRRILDGGEEPEELLPTQQGFFFGDTDYDEVYKQDLKLTIEQLTPLLFQRNGDTFVYRSSW